MKSQKIEIDFEKLMVKAKSYAIRKGMNNEDADEFAQESCIRALNSREGYIKLDYVYADFRDYHRADKRILSSSQGQLSGFRTISLDTPIDNSNTDSSKLGDFIADPRIEHGIGECFSEIEYIVGKLLRCTTSEARAWAMKSYNNYLMENL